MTNRQTIYNHCMVAIVKGLDTDVITAKMTVLLSNFELNDSDNSETVKRRYGSKDENNFFCRTCWSCCGCALLTGSSGDVMCVEFYITITFSLGSASRYQGCRRRRMPGKIVQDE